MASRAVLAGVFLGLYLLGWTSGSLFVAMIGAWLITVPFFAKLADITTAALATLRMSAVALAIVLVFQDPHLYRYSMQVAGLAGLLLIALILFLLVPRVSARTIRISIVGAGVLMALGAVVAAPTLTSQVLFDFMRLSPDPTRMSVLEARPLFLYSGNWNWNQPWEFFRSAFYLGAIAVVMLAADVWRTRRTDHWLIVIVTTAMFAATIGQNRFGYYLVPACAVVMAWWSVRVLDWGGVPHAGNPSPKIRAVVPMQRELAVILVAGLAVAPNLVPAALTTTRTSGMPASWADVMEWLRTQTPSPFSSDDYYLARYDPANLEKPLYTVMNWWDQGYWILQTGHRVPAANPTQARAGDVAKFYIATDEARAIEVMNALRARYVLADWELPFRSIGGGALGGRFENVVTWAGQSTPEFYQVCFARVGGQWEHVWLFREAYYQTMAYRLSVLGGTATNPVNNTWVVRLDQRTDTTGRTFCEVSDRQRYRSAGEAKAAAQQKGAGYHAVGLTPWEPAFPVAAMTAFRLDKDFRDRGQPMDQAPMVRVFERITNNQ